MVKGSHRQTIPNEHKEPIRQALLKRLLEQAGITREEWEKL